MIWRCTGTLVACWRVHTCTAVKTWLPYAVINGILTVDPSIPIWALATVWGNSVHTGTPVLAWFRCTIIYDDLAVCTDVSRLTFASVGIQVTDAYTIVLARVWGAFVDFHLAESLAVSNWTLTVVCSRFINTIAIYTGLPLIAEAVGKLTLVASIFSGAQAFEGIYLRIAYRGLALIAVNIREALIEVNYFCHAVIYRRWCQPLQAILESIPSHSWSRVHTIVQS